jgi:hypothetical protein
MRHFRLSISWLMFAVTVIAMDIALLRNQGGAGTVALIWTTSFVLTCDVLAIGLFRILTRRGESHPRLIRFEKSGLVVLFLCAICPYLSFCQPVVATVDALIGTVTDRLIVLFWHPLSDFDLDQRNPFGRLVTYIIIILFPAMLLTGLLSGLALIGVLMHRRHG